MRRAHPKAYQVKFGKLAVCLSPEAFHKLRRDDATSYAMEKADCERIVGNRKFELSPSAAVSEFSAALKKANPGLKAAYDKRQAIEERRWAAYQKKEKARRAEEERKKAAERAEFFKAHPLPKGIEAGDLADPGYEGAKKSPALSLALRGDDYGDSSFEIWYTARFGWVAPTLLIRQATWRNKGASNRTYAVALSNGALCRVGFGPHVLKQLKVYITPENIDRLERDVVEILGKGAVAANECRDRISTRRALSSRRRFW